jgi:hypothetical protein
MQKELNTCPGCGLRLGKLWERYDDGSGTHRWHTRCVPEKPKAGPKRKWGEWALPNYCLVPL